MIFNGRNQNLLQNAAQRSASNRRTSLFREENVPASAGPGTLSPVPGGPMTSAPNAGSGGANVVTIQEIVVTLTTGGTFNFNGTGTSLIFAGAYDETVTPPVGYPTFLVTVSFDPNVKASGPISLREGQGVEGLPFQSFTMTWNAWTSASGIITGRFWVISNPAEAKNPTESQVANG